jgi:uncharacterized protein YyaL (SSP411 family)
MPNHLVNEISPYLLQHASNPVDWYPWGAEALAKALEQDKPIFLSIGYAACHWCHVMAHESFEDAATAALMNANFICIKVDREQRPDLDSIYMDFVVAATGQGGWPMSVFLTPSGQPFYGGTYFPLFRRHNLPAFREVLDTVARLWRSDRQAILSSSDNFTQRISAQLVAPKSDLQLNPSFLKQVSRTIADGYDRQNGGWGSAPKFPQPMLIEFLLRQATRGDQDCLDMAVHALRSMAQGGMYDILGGGFARYSVDSTWHIPHFEKMLYDNAQLALVYLHAHLLTGDPFFREVCESTLDFVLRELTHPAGGFFSSLDADSEGEEGKFYLWMPQDIRLSLVEPADADLFIAAYSLSQSGNFEGRNILRRTLTDEQLAQQFHRDPASIPPYLSGLRRKLLSARNSRVHPAVDDKVLVSWNALMLTALSEAGRSLDRQDYIEAAVLNAGFILEEMNVGGTLVRSWRAGRGTGSAYLEDYAGFALSLLALYQADPHPRWYQASLWLLEQVQANFTHPSGGFFDTSDDHQPLLYRPMVLQDNATPSGNALAAMLLLQLSAYEGRSDWRSLAEQMLTSILGLLMRYPSGFAHWLCAADFSLGPLYEVAVLGNPDDPATQAMLARLNHAYHPRLVLASSSYPPLSGSPALLNDRPMLNAHPTAYVCRGFVCRQPVNDPDMMVEQLSR